MNLNEFVCNMFAVLLSHVSVKGPSTTRENLFFRTVQKVGTIG